MTMLLLLSCVSEIFLVFLEFRSVLRLPGEESRSAKEKHLWLDKGIRENKEQHLRNEEELFFTPGEVS